MTNKKYEFEYKCAPGEVDAHFSVICLDGEEALGRPHRFELTLMSESKKLVTKNLINRPGCLLLHADTIDNKKTPDRHTRYVGVIAEMEKLHSFGERFFYRVVFVSEIWKLSLFNASFFYKTDNKNVIDLIEYISNLSYESGEKYLAQTELVTFRLTQNIKNYQPRDFFLQYNESRLNFLQRWMEKEGIYYTITGHEDFKEKITLYSDVSQLLRRGRKCVTVTYRPIATANTSDVDDSIYKFAQNSKILPKYIKLRDYNYSQASVELTVTQKVSDSGFGELDIFGENYRDVVEGEHYAKNYAEALQCDAFSYHGSGSATGIAAGCFIDFLGTEYLVTKVKHTGSQAAAFLGADVCEPLGFKVKDGYQCDFEALAINPSDSDGVQQQFRMQRITPKPVVAGNLSALIKNEDGLDGSYALIDSDGKYYVEFKSIDIVNIKKMRMPGEIKGIKIRQSTPYAGFDHGIHFPLRQGDEVLVAFTNGDPDLPVIVGAVNNSLSPSLSTHENRTDNIIKTPSGNRITLSDHKERRGITLAVPSVENGTHYDAVQTISPGEDPKISSWVDTIRGDKYSNFLGSSFSLSAGTSSSISASLSSSVSLASSVSMSAGISNTINLGSMGVSWSPKIPKIHDLVTHTSLSLGDGGQSVSYGNDSQVIETHKSFEIKTGAIDDSLDAKVLESNEVFLKSAIAASLVFDIAASFALQQAPEIAKAVKVGRIEKNYKKAIDDANLKYKESISKAEQITEEQNRLEEKRQAINVLEEDKDAAANIRSEELKDLEKDFFVDNGWGMRLTSNGARAVIQAASNIAILEALRRHGKKLAEHKNNIGAYKNKLLMDNNGFCVQQDLLPREDLSVDENDYSVVEFSKKTVKNNFTLNVDGFHVKHNEGNIEQNINISSKGGGRIISIDNANNQKIEMLSKDESLLIQNGNYHIKFQKNGIYLGFHGKKDPANSSTLPEKYVAITEDGIFTTDKFEIGNGHFVVGTKSVSISDGVIQVTSNNNP